MINIWSQSCIRRNPWSCLFPDTHSCLVSRYTHGNPGLKIYDNVKCSLGHLQHQRSCTHGTDLRAFFCTRQKFFETRSCCTMRAKKSALIDAAKKYFRVSVCSPGKLDSLRQEVAIQYVQRRAPSRKSTEWRNASELAKHFVKKSRLSQDRSTTILK